MTTIRSLDDLEKIRAEVREKKTQAARHGHVQVLVGLGSCGIAAGALETVSAFKEQIDARGMKDIIVSPTGCNGLCHDEPIVQVIIGEQPKVTYGKVTPDAARRILKEHIQSGKVVQDYLLRIDIPSLAS
jgi:NADP-reducing hydrogenase subunit HndB